MLNFLDSATKIKREKKPRSRAAKKTIKIKNTNVFFQIPKYNKTFKPKKYKPESNNEFQQTHRSTLETDSTNMNFLQSLLPDMQSMDDRQRFEFKLGVMKLIKKIKYDREISTISINTDISLKDFTLCDQPATFIIQTSGENSPRSLSPINFSLTPQDEQLMIDDIEPEMQLISTSDLDLS